MKYILSIDQGTTGTTSVLIDANTFEIVDKTNMEFPQIFPSPGLVEHNLDDIWKTVESTVTTILKNNHVNTDDISAIGITNQRETTCAFDNNGNPLANAIVWQDRRTSEFCNNLAKESNANYIIETTGLTLDPYFSSTKMKWLLDNNDDVRKASESSNLKFGTIDTFLLYKLSGCTAFATEASNASRTMLMDLKTSAWDGKLLDIFNIKENYLPTIMPSFSKFGITKGLDFLPDGIPISGILGDQQAALFGQAGIKKGDIKCTYGTGAFMLLNTGTDLVKSENGLLTTVAYKTESETIYALEGSSFIAGAAVQWLRDNLNILETSPEIEALAEKATFTEMEYLLFLPFFTGIGSPHWKSEAKASIIGMTRDTGKAQIAKATLEGIAFSINDLYLAMEADLGNKLTEMKVDGGAASNNLLMQIQSTVSGSNITRPKVIETTAFGAALAAAIGVGLTDIDKVTELWKEDRTFSPNKDWESFYQKKVNQWNNAIKSIY